MQPREYAEKYLQPRQNAENTPTPAKNKPMDAKSVLIDMRQFLFNCQHDHRLTPQTQHVFWTLMAFSDKNFWSFPMAVSDAELKDATHIKSNKQITNIKRQLKNLGYIDFEKGSKPTKYTIFSPPILNLSVLYNPDYKPDDANTDNQDTPPYSLVNQESNQEVV